MNLVLGISEGFREVWAHKFRSVLTMVGVVLGVASLMATFALTAGMAAGVRESLQQLGGVERVEIRDAPVPPEQENMAEISPGRTYRDALAIRSSVPLVRYVSPEIDGPPGTKASRQGNSTNPYFVGAQEDKLATDRHVIAHGRFLSDLDLKFSHRVCVIGQSIVDELWDDPAAIPLGEKIDINGNTFTVVGIFTPYTNAQMRRAAKLGIYAQQEARRKSRGSSTKRAQRWDPFWPKNHAVIIPLTTMQVVFKSAQQDASTGIDAGPDLKLTRLTVQISDIHTFESAVQQMRNVLTLTHRGIRDFSFDTREDWFESIERSVRAAKLTGGFIAGISLLVGGLGITNIMLASIAERVRELGIRRAIGARSRDIFGQILIEGAVLAGMGGLIGLIVGYGLVQLLVVLAPTENAPLIENSSVMVSLSAAVAIGLLAGVYPAWKAAQLSPIQALRYE